MKKLLMVTALLSSVCMAGVLPEGVNIKGVAIMAAEQAGRRFVILDSASEDGYVWEWSPVKDNPNVAAIANRFGNPSDLRHKKDGKMIVICSGGGFAKIDIKTCKAEWAGVCPSANPHSIEELPDGRIATASSDGASVMIIDPREFPFDTKKQKKRKVLELKQAHGVVWDAVRKSLWAIGDTNIVELEYIPEQMGAKVKSQHDFVTAGCGKWGHDLLLGNDGKIYFTTHDTVSVFIPETRQFEILDRVPMVKSISHGKDGEVRCVARTKWWTDTIFMGDKKIVRPGAKFYKARYL